MSPPYVYLFCQRRFLPNLIFTENFFPSENLNMQIFLINSDSKSLNGVGNRKSTKWLDGVTILQYSIVWVSEKMGVWVREWASELVNEWMNE
jgi:hypothetical protein